MLKLPGLIDVHVHMRDPGAPQKEDWDSGTAAALAGGFTMVLAMPNTQPPVTGAEALARTRSAAAARARCDYGVFLGAADHNAGLWQELAAGTAGLKLYLNNTYGPLRLGDMTRWMEHLACWPAHLPVAAHAEGQTLAALVLLCSFAERPVHLCHVSRAEEIAVIRAAKDRGLRVTCEACPHHLFLSQEDAPRLGPGRSKVSPALGTPRDQQALWDNLEVIDCFATDHAPHTPEEKDGADAPPGFPGLETALPLLLTAVHEGRLTEQDLVTRLCDNPRRIFGLPEQPRTHVEVDPDERHELGAGAAHTRCGWTPFEGREVIGRVRRVVLRGQEAYVDGQVLAAPGTGREVCCLTPAPGEGEGKGEGKGGGKGKGGGRGGGGGKGEGKD